MIHHSGTHRRQVAPLLDDVDVSRQRVLTMPRAWIFTPFFASGVSGDGIAGGVAWGLNCDRSYLTGVARRAVDRLVVVRTAVEWRIRCLQVASRRGEDAVPGAGLWSSVIGFLITVMLGFQR